MINILKENIKKFLKIHFEENEQVFHDVDISLHKDILLISLILKADITSDSLDESKIKHEILEFLNMNDFTKKYNISSCEIFLSKQKNAQTNDVSQEEKLKSNKEKIFQKPEKIKKKIKGLKKIIMIASGKGGVGKSTLAANFALSLASLGWKVGLLDADIYGASIPLIFGLQDKTIKMDEEKQMMIPIIYKNEKEFGSQELIINSIAFITKSEEALIWRGPMITKALNQILNQTDWGELDFLIIDTPPGTGDIHLTLLENYELDLAFLISTPHITALANTQKTFSMFEKFNIKNFELLINMFDLGSLDMEKIIENFRGEKDFKNLSFLKHVDEVCRLPFFPQNQNSLFFFHEEYRKIFIEFSRKIVQKLLSFA